MPVNGRAVNGVTLRRSADSVAVLTRSRSSTRRRTTGSRRSSSSGTRRPTAWTADGMIRSTLETALDDPEEAIAAMAERALADLDALEAARNVN